MNIEATPLEGLLIVEPKVFADARGYFMETFQDARYRAHGVVGPFVQDNLSFSGSGTLRGLHFQVRRPQAKLVQVITGEVFDVAVDLRAGSATFGRWHGVYLSDRNHRQLFVPAGFAHGFCVLSEQAHLTYKCSDFYAPDDEGGLVWWDPDLDIRWPVTDPKVSPKDAALSRLADLPADRLPCRA